MTETASYAELEEFLDGWDQPPSQAAYPRIEQALADATAQLTSAIGFDFNSHPAESRVSHGTGTKLIHAHYGIVSLTKVEIARGPDLAYEELAATDWYLEPLYREPEEPYDHVMLAEFRNWWYVPYGQRRVRLTGTFGYEAVPRRVKSATIALARQLYRANQTSSGGLLGPDELAGNTPYPRGLPDAAYRVLDYYRHKFWCAV